jgi:UrcA family protein
MRHRLLAVFACVLAPAALAVAQPVSEVVIHAHPHAGDKEIKSLNVKLGDLNLGSANGAETAVGRIRRAAERACAPEPHPRELKVLEDYNACVNGAMKDAVGQTHSANVQGVYDRAD